MLKYFGDNYERLKKLIEVATKGNYSDEFYHHLILKLHDKKDIDNFDNYIFKFANKEYFMYNSEWNKQKRETIELTDEFTHDEDEQTNYEQQLNRYLHTHNGEADTLNKKIVLLYLSCKNQNEFYKRHKITIKTLNTAINYVTINFKEYVNSDNLHSV
jgi:hypothetical protein